MNIRKRIKIFFIIFSFFVVLLFCTYHILLFSTGIKTTSRIEKAVLKNNKVKEILYCDLYNDYKEVAYIEILLKNGFVIVSDDIRFVNKELIFSNIISINNYSVGYTRLNKIKGTVSSGYGWNYIMNSKSVNEIIDHFEEFYRNICALPDVIYDKSIYKRSKEFFDSIPDNYIEEDEEYITKYFREKVEP